MGNWKTPGHRGCVFHLAPRRRQIRRSRRQYRAGRAHQSWRACRLNADRHAARLTRCGSHRSGYDKPRFATRATRLTCESPRCSVHRRVEVPRVCRLPRPPAERRLEGVARCGGRGEVGAHRDESGQLDTVAGGEFARLLRSSRSGWAEAATNRLCSAVRAGVSPHRDLREFHGVWTTTGQEFRVATACSLDLATVGCWVQ